MMRFFLVFLFLFNLYVYSESIVPTSSEGFLGVVLDAEHIEFNRVSGDVIATHSVVLDYKGVTLNTESLYFNIQRSELNIPGPFNVRKDTLKVQADQFSYQFQTLSGTAYHFNALLDRLFIKGEKMIFSSEKVEVVHASFTTCSGESPHYVVRSRTLNIYPELGFLVAFDNWVHIEGMPFDVWLPTFVYGSTRYSILGSGAPIPQIGSTAREGFFIKDKLGYFLNPMSSGTFDFGYLSRLGWTFGITHSLGLTETSQLGISAHSVGSDGFEGGLIYGFSLLREPEKNKSSPKFESWMNKFSNAVLPLSRFSINYTFGELINDSRVDKAPVLGVQFNQIPLPSGVFFSAKTEAGRFLEKTLDNALTDTTQVSIEGDLAKHYQLSKEWVFGTGLSFLGHWYQTGETWERVLSRFSVQWLVLLHPELSFTKKVVSIGGSPFEFEQKYAIESDEVGLKLGHSFGDYAFAFESNYEIETQLFRTADWVISTRFHCWQTSLRWGAINGQVTFGVDLY